MFPLFKYSNPAPFFTKLPPVPVVSAEFVKLSPVPPTLRVFPCKFSALVLVDTTEATVSSPPSVNVVPAARVTALLSAILLLPTVSKVPKFTAVAPV